MSSKFQHILLTIFFSLFSASICFANVNHTGEYVIQFNFGNCDLSSNVISSDVTLTINLPKGNGSVHIPLPFPKHPAIRSIIEPGSDNNLVLLGFVRPNEQYTVVQVSLLDTPTKVFLSFENVMLPLQESSRSASGKAVLILMNQAYERVGGFLNHFRASQLKEIHIRTTYFQDSEPKAEMTGLDQQRKIRIGESLKSPPDVIVFLSGNQNQYSLYFVLGILGVFLGYFAAPKIISTPSKAKWYLLSSIIGMLAIAGIYFGLLPPEQRFTDTTTIVTIGTTLGLLIGLFISCLQFLFSQQVIEPET